jgi:hypothetical protein
MTPPADDANLPSSWSAENAEAAGRKGGRTWLFLALGVVVALAAVLIVIVVKRGPVEPVERAWPKSVGGRPAGLGADNETADEAEVTAKPGVYLWSSFDGWHLWVVTGDGVGAVKGTIASDEGIDRARLSADGQGTVAIEGEAATFSLPADAPVSGIDFEPKFFTKKLTVTLTDAAGKRIDPSVVTLGSATPATKVPIVIDKPVVTDSGS